MRLRCERCGSLIAAADINMQSMMAKCAQCATVFAFGSSVPGARTASGGLVKPQIPQPRGFEVRRDDVSLWLTRRWLSPMHFALLFFCGAWDSFLVFWYSNVPSEAPWIFSVFPVAHVAVGVGMTYYVLCGFLNKTELRLSRGSLSVRHGPLPWRGNKELSVQGLSQVFCQQGFHSAGREGQALYSVHALKDDGSRVELLSGLPSLEHAQYIEQQVEGFLGIQDSAVPGEAGGSVV
jgi:phage FluMu protein Com